MLLQECDEPLQNNNSSVWGSRRYAAAGYSIRRSSAAAWAGLS